jgi:hypothetical protein
LNISQYIQDLKDAQASRKRIKEGYKQQVVREQNPNIQTVKRDRKFGEIAKEQVDKAAGKASELYERHPQKYKAGTPLKGKEKVGAALSGKYQPEFLTRNPFQHGTITFKEEPKGTGQRLNDTQPKGNPFINSLGDSKRKRRSPFL